MMPTSLKGTLIDLPAASLVVSLLKSLNASGHVSLVLILHHCYASLQHSFVSDDDDGDDGDTM